ncbi:MBL fold metallo-hydrolase [Chloroflexota bacterium]
MSSPERLDNIYVIDTKMFGLDKYNAAYLVEGKELALIDTGMPEEIEALHNGIKAHGFHVSDISHIFVTHCEHPDHSGNAGALLQENTKAKVYINPIGAEYLTDPATTGARFKADVTSGKIATFEKMVPVPPSRIQYLNDGDVFDLGNGEKLKAIFAPGHQPSGIVILEEKNKGLFINDLVGNYFPEADSQYPLNSEMSDNIRAIESLKKLIDLPVDYLYLGHYGICDRPREVMARAIKNMEQCLELGARCVSEGKPENIGAELYKLVMPELEKLRPVRGETLYSYAVEHHMPRHVKFFTAFCQEKFNK